MDVRGVVQIADERSSVVYRSRFPLRVTPPLEMSDLIPRWTQPTTQPKCTRTLSPNTSPSISNTLYSRQKKGKEDCVNREIFDKNIQQRWGAYVHVAFYFTLDFNRMDTCMHSRIRTPASFSRARASPRKESPSEGGQRFCYRQYRDC